MHTNNDVPALLPAGGGRITARLLAPQERMRALPQQFGASFLAVEHSVYQMMRYLCAEYQGGYWDYYALSNGGFFMAPTTAAHYRLYCDGNGYEGVFTADAAGVGVCAMTYSQLSFAPGGARLAEEYYRLRDYIELHPAVRQLLDLLD